MYRNLKDYSNGIHSSTLALATSLPGSLVKVLNPYKAKKSAVGTGKDYTDTRVRIIQTSCYSTVLYEYEVIYEITCQKANKGPAMRYSYSYIHFTPRLYCSMR